jgi:hypothetical protein
LLEFFERYDEIRDTKPLILETVSDAFLIETKRITTNDLEEVNAGGIEKLLNVTVGGEKFGTLSNIFHDHDAARHFVLIRVTFLRVSARDEKNEREKSKSFHGKPFSIVG